MKKTPVFILFCCISAIVLSAACGFCQDIKERMKDRLPKIVEMKKKGLIGENNVGLLQFLGETRENEDILTAENKDRQKVYEAIAEQQGVSAELVGKRRAIQIAEKAESGEWLQDEKGAWYQKE